MDLGSLTSTIEKNASKLGIIGGVLTGSPWGTGAIADVITKAARGQIHLPDFGFIQGYVNSAQFHSAVMAAVVGYAIEELAPGKIAKYGKIIQDAALGYIGGSAALWTAAAITSSQSGSDPTKPGFNPEWYKDQSKTVQQNFANAPLAQTYY